MGDKMADSVNVRNLQVIADLRNAINRFAGNTEDNLRSLALVVRKTLEWSRGCVESCHRDLRRCREDVEWARNALSNCHSRTDEDEEPDCSREAAALSDAKRHAQEAEDTLHKARTWQESIQRAAERFRVHGLRLHTLATSRAKLAQAQLAAHLANLERYQSSSGPSATAVPFSISTSNTMPTVSGNWLERGMQNVSVADLPMPDGIQGPDDFMKVSMDEMRAGLLRLQEMLPTIQSGQGASSDFWAAYDREHGLDPSNGYKRVYDAFFGLDAIRLEKIGNTYSITNGRHRIWLAKHMGLDSLPVNLTERA